MKIMWLLLRHWGLIVDMCEGHEHGSGVRGHGSGIVQLLGMQESRLSDCDNSTVPGILVLVHPLSCVLTCVCVS